MTTATTLTPENMLDRLLTDALPDEGQRKAAIHALLDDALSAQVLWGWGPRGYEDGFTGAPVSAFLTVRTRRIPEAEVSYPGSDLGQARPLLHHLLAPTVSDAAQRDAVIGAVDVNGVLWAPMDAKEDAGTPYGVAAQFADGRPLGRCVEVRTRRFHEDD